MNNYIYWDISGGGLANKIKWWVSSMRVKDYYKLPIIYYWNNGPHLSNCNFENLFQNKLNFLTDKNLFLKRDKLVFLDGWRLYLFENDIDKNFAKAYPHKQKDIDIRWAIHEIGPFNGECIDCEYNRIPKNLIDIYLQYFKSIKPNSLITDIVNNFSKKNFNDNVVGVHIRRSDFLKYKGGRGKTDEKYFFEMDEILKKNPDTQFFICTDCQITQDTFINRYSNSLYYKKRNRLNTRDSITGIQDAFIDILLLSKLKLLLVTELSTFTEVAWWFGECQAIIKTI